jgi:hypothetical protein
MGFDRIDHDSAAQQDGQPWMGFFDKSSLDGAKLLMIAFPFCLNGNSLTSQTMTGTWMSSIPNNSQSP